MKPLLAAAAVIAFVALTPAARAAPVAPDGLLPTPAEEDLAYAKWKGGKGWKGGKKAKWGRGPPPWAPAWGYRRKRGW
jgi:hypothetical protein